MQLTKEKRGECSILLVHGRLDGTTSPKFETEVVAWLSAGGKAFVLDMAGISFMSSAALRVLLSMAKRVGRIGGKVVLSSPNAVVSEVFEISNFSSMFTICPTLDEGVAASTQGLEKSAPAAPAAPIPPVPTVRPSEPAPKPVPAPAVAAMPPLPPPVAPAPAVPAPVVSEKPAAPAAPAPLPVAVTPPPAAVPPTPPVPPIPAPAPAAAVAPSPTPIIRVPVPPADPAPAPTPAAPSAAAAPALPAIIPPPVEITVAPVIAAPAAVLVIPPPVVPEAAPAAAAPPPVLPKAEEKPAVSVPPSISPSPSSSVPAPAIPSPAPTIAPAPPVSAAAPTPPPVTASETKAAATQSPAPAPAPATLKTGPTKLELIVGPHVVECRDGDVIGSEGTLAPQLFKTVTALQPRHVLIGHGPDGWFLLLPRNVQVATHLDDAVLAPGVRQPLSAEHRLKVGDFVASFRVSAGRPKSINESFFTRLMKLLGRS